MKIEIAGRRWKLAGEDNPLARAVTRALEDNGAPVLTDASAAPDILIASAALVPDEGYSIAPLLDELRATAAAMQARGGGRIVLLLGAAAAIPLRRFPAWSAQMAAGAATARALAMAHAPVMANAVGVGLIGASEGDAALAGDAAMQGHAALGRPGAPEDVVGAALFFCDPLNSYTTGQMLCVDGGWTTGYGRNF